MTRSLDNLTDAALQKNEMVEKLMTANEWLVKALVGANAGLTRLCLPAPATALAGRSTSDHPSQWSPSIPDWDPTGLVFILCGTLFYVSVAKIFFKCSTYLHNLLSHCIIL
jgi:hypothetical protein